MLNIHLKRACTQMLRNHKKVYISLNALFLGSCVDEAVMC